VSEDIKEMVDQIHAIQQDISDLAGRSISLSAPAQTSLWKTTTDGAEPLRRQACEKPPQMALNNAQTSMWKITTDDAEPTRRLAFEIYLGLRWTKTRSSFWKLLLMALDYCANWLVKIYRKGGAKKLCSLACKIPSQMALNH
jgi:hypothetical protein